MIEEKLNNIYKVTHFTHLEYKNKTEIPSDLGHENYGEVTRKGVEMLVEHFKEYFNENTILIPTPKSSLPQKDDLWVPQRITSALAGNGLGRSEDCLLRKTPLPRSSKVSAPNRPKASQHYDSMNVRELLFKPKEIVLVDDVITRGATVLGAVNKLAEVFPETKIRVFAVMRTISNSDEFSKIIDPCVGTVSLVGVDTFRSP